MSEQTAADHLLIGVLTGPDFSQARCSCGWEGPERTSPSDARQDVESHLQDTWEADQ